MKVEKPVDPPLAERDPLGMRAGQADERVAARRRGPGRCVSSPRITSGRPPAFALRDARQDADVARDAGRRAIAPAARSSKRGRRLDIGRLDPALPRARHAADDDGKVGRRIERREMSFQDGAKAGLGRRPACPPGCAVRRARPVRPEQPDAKARRSPIDGREDGAVPGDALISGCRAAGPSSGRSADRRWPAPAPRRSPAGRRCRAGSPARASGAPGYW